MGIPSVYFMSTFYIEWMPGAIAVFMSTVCSSVTFFNPITTIFFVRCFRRALFKSVGG